jgi:F-type H+-transporting ATPase subunit b
MQELLSQLGINWELLLSQAVNFALLLIVLRIFVYKPVLKLLHDRRDKIEGGLLKAAEADKRLYEVDAIGKTKIKEAETHALGIIKKTEVDAKELEAKLLGVAKQHEEEAMKSAAVRLRAQEEESRRATEREAAQLVRAAIERTVELSPNAIDDALIARAVQDVKKSA